MNILFLTIGGFESIYQHDMYPDILRYFMNKGHEVYIAGSYERKTNKNTKIICEGNSKLLKIRIGNITKCGMIEKGISTLLISYQYKKAINVYFNKIKFDLILFSTPPITLVSLVKYIKKRDNAFAYLMLKDIFPQNAMDLGSFKKNMMYRLLYYFFRVKEKELYNISDKIGCMSPANIEYIKRNNPQIYPKKIELCPNCFEYKKIKKSNRTRNELRNKYHIPINKTVFVYGGNLGISQGIDFLLDCIKNCNNTDAFFLIVGDGTEYDKIERYIHDIQLKNIKLIKFLPKQEYDEMIGSCDVGLIFLNHKFTIPNFPSRILSYMQAELPVLAATDTSTDIGKIIVNNNFGWWCESNNSEKVVESINLILHSDLCAMGKNASAYFKNNYTSQIVYDIIISSTKNK